MISASASSGGHELRAARVAERRGGLEPALALAAQHGQLVVPAVLRRLLELGEHEAQRAHAVLLARLHRGCEILLDRVGNRHPRISLDPAAGDPWAPYEQPLRMSAQTRLPSAYGDW